MRDWRVHFAVSSRFLMTLSDFLCGRRMYLWEGVAVALITLLTLGGLEAEPSVDYCGLTCPQVENIIKGEIDRKQAVNPAAAARLVRIFFHDCFVDGCDASVMITSTAPHKADIKLSLSGDGFDAQCRGIVSCADIRATATRDLLNLAFVRSWHTACRKSSAVVLVPDSKKFAVNMLFKGPCQLGFIFKVDRMITPVQNPESRKNSKKWLQFTKVESFILMGIDEHRKNLWVSQYMQFMKHTRVATMEKVFKGRSLLEPP